MWRSHVFLCCCFFVSLYKLFVLLCFSFHMILLFPIFNHHQIENIAAKHKAQFTIYSIQMIGLTPSVLPISDTYWKTWHLSSLVKYTSDSFLLPIPHSLMLTWTDCCHTILQLYKYLMIINSFNGHVVYGTNVLQSYNMTLRGNEWHVLWTGFDSHAYICHITQSLFSLNHRDIGQHCQDKMTASLGGILRVFPTQKFNFRFHLYILFY